MAAAIEKKDRAAQDPRIEGIVSSIRVVPHVPKGGTLFFTPLLRTNFMKYPFIHRPVFLIHNSYRLSAHNRISFSEFSGIMFQDITTLLLNPKVFKDTVDLFIERYIGTDISAVAGNFLNQCKFSFAFAINCCHNSDI
jgi:hypothetical protein